MAFSTEIFTYFEGTWHAGNPAIMRAADHGAWQGTNVFDGARYFDGVAPDLRAHCARVNASAEALMLKPTVSVDEMVAISWEGLANFPQETAVYIRPMYWAIDGDDSVIVPSEETTGFCICLEASPIPGADATSRLTRTRFRRPTLDTAVLNAKAGCLYPNNGRMIAEARSRGYPNALSTDMAGNVAETATSNVFMVRDGEVLTPIANGTFLAGITRGRHMKHLAADGNPVREAVLTYEDFEQADEVFTSGNYAKVTPILEFDGVSYQSGPVARRVREMYWDWALSEGAP